MTELEIELRALWRESCITSLGLGRSTCVQDANAVVKEYKKAFNIS